MEYGFLSRAGKFLQEQTKRRRWTMVFLCLAAGVTLGTVGFLKLYGQAMTHKVKMLECQYEVHVHTEDCYEENEDGEEVLVCGLADYVIHVHNDDCYDQKGNLVCTLEEHELHEHDDSCYEEEEVLICGEEEAEGSSSENVEDGTGEDVEAAADDSREAETGSGPEAETGKELACEKEEHTHDADCYADGAGCEKEAHTHDAGCYETTETLVCSEEEHTHDDSCYSEGESELTCGESEHTHDDGCYDEDGNLTCEETEHEHDDSCYSEGESELVCGKDEHTHGDGCYEVEETLVCETEEHEHDDSCAAESELTCEIEEHEHDDSCYTETEAGTKEETASEPAKEAEAEETAKTEEPADDGEAAEDGHTHTDDCYETQEVLTCGELELHTHDADPESETCCYTEDCFDGEGNLIEGSHPSCGLLQLEEHIHTEECFRTVELTPEEIAALNGGATLHVHTDECYDEEGNLICGHEVTHLHQLECYDEDGNLICGFGGEQKPEHEHDANCYDEEGNLICGNEDAKDHEHDANCYDEEGNLTCEYEGVKDHEHDANCYDEEGNLICGYEGVKDHEHDANCYDEEGNLICGYEDAKVHEHDANCYDEEGNLICGYEGAKVHEHDAKCYDMYGELICGYEGAADHVHTEACYNEEGNLICGYELREEYTNSRTFEGEKYIVIAKYNDDANIPEEAELLVEEITPDSDKEHYTRRETEYREMMEDEMASMRALLKIGFYVETEGEEEKTEIEPETPVMVSVQFLDEDGLPEGRPVTVIHFAEDGTEMLDGGSAVDNSTTFRMESFSEIAIGYVPEEEQRQLTQAVDGTMRLHLADSFEYEDDAFQITFHVEGEAILPKDTIYGVAENGDVKEEKEDTDSASEKTTEGKSDTEIAAETENEAEADTSPDAEETEEAETETSENTGDQEKTDSVELTGTDDEADSSTEAEETEKKDSEDQIEGQEASQGVQSDETSEEKKVSDGDDTVTASADPDNKKAEIPRLRFKVEQADKGSAEYQAFKEHAEEIDGAEELYRIQVMTYSLTYGEEELDLSRCKVTAEIRPAQALEDQMEKSIPDAAAFLLDGEGKVVQNETEVIPESAPYFSEDDETETTGKTDTETGLKGGDQEGNESDSEPASDPENEVNLENEGDPENGSDLENEGDPENEPDSADMTDVQEGSDPDGVAFIDDLTEYYGDPGEYVPTEITFSVSLMSDDKPVDRATRDYDGSGAEPMMVNLSNADFFAARVSGQPNPKFTVQYYANLDILNKTGSNALPVIDTSGKKLPKNGKGTSASPNDNAIKNIYVDGSGNVLTTKTVTEVYKSRPFEYHKAPTFNYINALVKNPNYKLKEVWVLKNGKNATSIAREDWDIYTYSKNLHFTNRSVSGTAKPGGSSGYVLIKDGATLRLVYDTTNAKPDFKAAFYDYDITSGRMYTSVSNAIYNKNTGITQTGNQQDGTLYYTYTKEAGINSAGNYSGNGTKLAFGNVNTGTTMGENLWGGNLLNKYNGTQGGHPTVAGSYKGCTFGLVTGLSNGKIQYANNVLAPNLFNEGSATGKTSYDKEQYSLKFIRAGDTYTLTAVNGTGAAGLESFGHPSPNSTTTHTHIWTNDFWPMDSAGSYGTNGHDLKFGSYEYRGNRAYAGSSTTGEPGSTAASKKDYPYSDDGLDHNSYFGMQYTVEFELSKDYVGPLEYYFFGDDDMWVFLDNQLVCDIGGVHSSVGEYVNLWDYLAKGSEGKHTLSFFYTERGASGSTCWMQFTLPSVSSLTPETTDEDYGHLKIEKTVTQNNNGNETVVDNNDVFTFTINFTDQDGKKLPDDYSYVKYDKDGKEIGSDLIIWDGGEFTLKNGEYIIVQYLPQGTRYKVTETNGAITITDNVSETSKVEYFTDITIAGTMPDDKKDLTDNKVAEGSIPKSDTTEVKYNNKFYVYGLPETGGPGITLYTMAGVVVILFGAGFLYKKKFRERRV